MSEIVYVAELGHGPRRGKVVKRYQGDNGRGVTIPRVVVQLDDQDTPRDCFASGVFDNQRDAYDASVEVSLTRGVPNDPILPTRRSLAARTDAGR